MFLWADSTTRSMCVKSCEEYGKSMWKKETMWNKSEKYYSSYSHACEIFRMHVKLFLKPSLYMWFTHVKQFSLDVKFFCSCEFFSHVWNNFIVYMKCFQTCKTIFFCACEIFFHVKQFCPACEICYTCETILLCMWNLSMHVNFMFHAKFFSHMGNSLVMHVNFSTRVND